MTDSLNVKIEPETVEGWDSFDLDIITVLEREMILYLYKFGIIAYFSHQEENVKGIFDSTETPASYVQFFEYGEYLTFLRNMNQTGQEIVKKVKDMDTNYFLDRLENG